VADLKVAPVRGGSKLSTMKVFFALPLFLLVMATSSSTIYAQERAILDAEIARFTAQVEKNTPALQQLLDDSLYYLHSNGLIEDKQDFISSVNSGKIVYSRMASSQQRLNRYGKMAVLTGLVMVDGEYEGNAFSIGLYYTSIYRKKRGEWLLVNWQSTRKPD
jgi:hypothetical protein